MLILIYRDVRLIKITQSGDLLFNTKVCEQPSFRVNIECVDDYYMYNLINSELTINEYPDGFEYGLSVRFDESPINLDRKITFPHICFYSKRRQNDILCFDARSISNELSIAIPIFILKVLYIQKISNEYYQNIQRLLL